MSVFSDNIKKLRKVKGVTQKQLAEELNISENGFQNYELDTRKPYNDILIALADYFDVSIDYLVGRTDKPEINK